MRKLLLSLALLVFAAPISAYTNDDKAPAVNLDGTQYIGFYSVDMVELEPDPKGDFNLPIYMHFVERGGVVYGTAVVPGYVEEQFAPPQSVLGFRTWPLYDGSWAGNKLIIQSEEERNAPVKRILRFAKGGRLLKVTFKTDSGNLIFRLTQCNTDGSYSSGMYLGSVEPVGAQPGVTENLLVGALVEGTQITVNVVYINPQTLEPGTSLLTGVYNPATGAFSVESEEEEQPDMQGVVGDGIMQFTAIFDESSSFPTDQISTTLYLFGTSRPKTPKPKRIKPKTVSAGGETNVRVSHRFALPGCVARLVSVGTSPSATDMVSIRKFYFNEKYLRVLVNAPVGAAGQYRVEITNPDGRKTSSKRFFTVQ